MTREEVKAILGESATDEQVSSLLDKFHKGNMEIVDKLNNATNKLNSYKDYDELKSKLNSLEQAQMSEQEKIELANKEAQKKLAEANKIYNTAKAKQILAGLEDDEDIISTVVRDNEEDTVKLATKLAEKYRLIQESVAKKTKEELSTLDIKPNVNETNLDNGAMTWDKYTNLSYDEQVKFQAEHPDEFSKL